MSENPLEEMAKALRLDVTRNGKPLRLPDQERDHMWFQSAMKPYCRAQVEAALAAADRCGYVLVPKQPTDEMLSRASQEVNAAQMREGTFAGLKYWEDFVRLAWVQALASRPYRPTPTEADLGALADPTKDHES